MPRGVGMMETMVDGRSDLPGAPSVVRRTPLRGGLGSPARHLTRRAFAGRVGLVGFF